MKVMWCQMKLLSAGKTWFWNDEFHVQAYLCLTLPKNSFATTIYPDFYCKI
jgi:hypothetical protein